MLNRVFRVGTDQTGQVLDVELDLRHAPLIIKESGCNANTKNSEHATREITRQVSVRRESNSEDASMRLSHFAQDRLDLTETATHVAQRMREPRKFDFIPLDRAARYLVGKPKAAIRIRRQKHVHTITVFVDSDFAGDAVSRKSPTGLVAPMGAPTVTSVSTLQSLTALSVGEAAFCAVVTGGELGLSLRSVHVDLGIHMKVEIESGSSTANSLTDRLGSVSRRCRQRKIVQMLERNQSLLQYYNKVASLQECYSTDHGSHTPLHEDGTSVVSSRRRRCRTGHRNRQLSELAVNIERSFSR